MPKSTDTSGALTPEEARRLVTEAGSIDKAAKLGGHPVGRFRTFCRELGISAKRGKSFPVFDPSEDVPRELLLEQENRELVAQVRRMSELAVRDERILEAAQEILPALKPRYEPRRTDRRKKPVMTPHEAVLLWGDVHAAEVITEDESGGLNAYDWSEMLDRHSRITESVMSFIEHRPYEVPVLHIAGLGDFLSGTIHDLSETNEKVILEATLQFGVDMANWVESLIPVFDRVNLVAVHGNHGRTSQIPKSKRTAVENYDWLAMEILKLRLGGYSSVTVEASKSPYAIMDVLGKKFFVFHGDGVRSSMQGFPAGGLVRRVREFEKTFSAHGRLDYFVCGHFHQAQVLDQGRIFVNGSVVGPNGYSLKNYGGGSPAQQTLLMVHPTMGITEVLPIDLPYQRGRS